MFKESGLKRLYLTHFFKEHTVALLLKMGTLALALGVSILFARLLGTSEFGLYSTWMATLSIVYLPVSATLSLISTRQLSRKKSGFSIGDLCFLTVVLIVTGFVVFVAVYLQLGSFGIGLAACFYAVIAASLEVLTAFFRSNDRPLSAMFLEPLLRQLFAITITLIYIALNERISLEILLVVHCVGVFFAMLAAILFAYFAPSLPPLLVRKRTLTGLSNSKDIPLVFLQNLLGSGVANMPVIVAANFFNMDSAGFVRVAIQLVSSSLLALSVAQYVGAAGFARDSDLAERANAFVKSTVFGLALGAPLLLLVVVLSSYLIQQVFLQKDVFNASFIYILACSSFFVLLAGPSGIFLNMRGDVRGVLSSLFIGFGLMLVVFVCTYDEYGLLSIAFALAANSVSVKLFQLAKVIFILRGAGSR